MTTMLEKVAGAMLVPAQQSRGWHIDASRGLNAVEIDGTVDLIALARAALQAIREPDGPVCEAGAEAWEVTAHMRPTFTAMIDAILEGKA